VQDLRNGRQKGGAAVRPANIIYRQQCTSLRAAALAMVTLLAMAQVGALLHFSLVEHAFSLRTGTLVHCDAEAPAGPRHDESPGSRHETCEVSAALHQAASPSVPLPSLVAPDSTVHHCVRVPEDEIVIQAWARYLLAPSHSPPSTAV
jgi:hypothetical protein